MPPPCLHRCAVREEHLSRLAALDTKNERALFHRSFLNWRVKKVPFDAIKATLALFILYEWGAFLHELGERLDTPGEVGNEASDVR